MPAAEAEASSGKAVDWGRAVTVALGFYAFGYIVWIATQWPGLWLSGEMVLALAGAVSAAVLTARYVHTVQREEALRRATDVELAQFRRAILAAGDLARGTDEQELFRALVTSARTLAEATSASLFVRDVATGVVSLLHAEPDLHADLLAACIAIADRVASSGTEVLSADRADPLLASMPAHLGVNSYFACPLPGPDEHSAMLILLSSGSAPRLSGPRMVPIGLLASVAGALWHHADRLPRAGDGIRYGLDCLASCSAVTMAVARALRRQQASLQRSLALFSDRNGHGPTSHPQVAVFEQAEMAVRALERIADNLADATAIARGDLQLQIEGVDVAGVVAQVISWLRPLLDPRDVNLTDGAGRLRARADLARLWQVIENLLLNAAAYSRPGDPITVIVRAEAQRVLVEVRDGGPGIGPEEWDRVWDAFYSSPRHVLRCGLGIGLTLVRALVRMQNGDVWFESQPNGTRVGFWLPATADAAQA